MDSNGSDGSACVRSLREIAGTVVKRSSWKGMGEQTRVGEMFRLTVSGWQAVPSCRVVSGRSHRPKKALPEHRSSRRVCSAARRDRRGRQSTAVAPTTLRQVDDRQALNRMPGSVADAAAISAGSDARPRIANSKQSGRRMFGGGKGSC